jgi:hypothetical protein
MRKTITVLALAMLPGFVAAQGSPIQPNCSADRRGDRVTTSVQYPNGYVAEAPWRVAGIRRAPSALPTLVVTAVLDRVVEYNPSTRERVATNFPAAVEIEVEVQSEDEIVPAVARVWCATVTRVRGAAPEQLKPLGSGFLKVTALPRARIVA